MATIAELVLKLRGDNTQLRQTLEDSAQRAQGFVTIIQDAMARGRNAAQSAGLGALAAQQFLDSMKFTIGEETNRIKELQYNMFITPAEASRQAGELALAFNNTILQTLSSLRASGNLTPTIERQLISSLDKAGLKAGQQLQEAIQAGMKSGQAATEAQAVRSAQGTFTAYTAEAENALSRTKGALVNAEGSFTTFGRRGATALVGLGFGIESFANGTESGMRRALRSVETFALFMGPEGLLAAALITAGLAIYDHFHKVEKQIDETLKHAMEAVSTAANAMDQIGLEKALREVQYGQPTSVDPKTGELIIHKRSEFAVNAFEGSAADLAAKLQNVNDKIEAATKDHNVALVGKLMTQAKDLDTQLQPLRDKYSQIQDLLLNPAPQAPLPQAPKPIEIKGKNAQQQSAEATKEYYESLSILVARLEDAKTSGRGYADILMQILEAYDKLGGSNLSARLGEKPEETQKRISMLKELHRTLLDIGAHANVSAPTVNLDSAINDQLEKAATTPQVAGQFGEQAKQFQDFIRYVEEYQHNIELTNMDLAAHHQQLIDINQALKPLRDQAVAMAEDLRKALRAAGLDPAIIDLMVQQWLDGLRKIGVGADDATDKLSQMVRVLSGIGDLFQALGDKQSAQIFSNISRAVNDVGAAVAKGGKDPVADIQAAASVVSAVKSLFDSPLHREQLAVMRENNLRLHEVALRLQGFSTNASNATAAATAAGQAEREHPGVIGALEVVGKLQDQIDVLTPYLQKVGLTWLQFAQIAKDQGFQIFDSHGRIIESALNQFIQGMNGAVRALFTFQDTLSDQQSLANLQAKLTGAPDTPQAQVNRDLALIQKLAPNLLPGASAQGGQNQDALRKMLQDLVQRIAAGKVNPEDFGGFQNLQELIGIIDQTAGALNDLRNVTNGVTAALENVPTGFKLALTEFDAQDAVRRNLGKNTPPEFTPPLASGGITLNVEAGAISIDPTNKNAADIGRETLENLKSLAGQKLGNRARWSELV